MINYHTKKDSEAPRQWKKKNRVVWREAVFLGWTHMHIHTHTHTHKHTWHMHKHTRVHAHTHTHTHTHTHAQTHTHKHVHKHTHTRTHTHTLARTHTRVHTHTHLHVHKHRHTHTHTAGSFLSTLPSRVIFIMLNCHSSRQSPLSLHSKCFPPARFVNNTKCFTDAWRRLKHTGIKMNAFQLKILWYWSTLYFPVILWLKEII